MMQKIGCIIYLLCVSYCITAQNAREQNLVQFSGIVMEVNSPLPVFYATVYNTNNGRGTITSPEGFFSFVVHKGDTVRFSAVGYVDALTVVPDTIQGNRYSVLQFLKRDTILLPEAIIKPWPKPEEFKSAFLALDLPEDDYTRAQKNLEKETIRDLQAYMSMDGNENFDFQMRQYSQSLYTAGQYPHLRIFDPMAWVQFFKALKRGDFKRKD